MSKSFQVHPTQDSISKERTINPGHLSEPLLLQLKSHAKSWFDVATSQDAKGIDVHAGEKISHAQHCAPAVKTVQLEALVNDTTDLVPFSHH
ncbi:hypothetical protein PoB_005170100 [Plakobranchus ocellatus]|uniref:Uncharacterized protein n=1 Tax=Plakobranchus ocellatus TaxID=259542 RepID=A0AAV4BPM9_9GAST|nr:hypothetical protein PoB_005170100 [Plakobranchus ocellatus]